MRKRSDRKQGKPAKLAGLKRAAKREASESEKRLVINSPLRKTFSELFMIYTMMHLSLSQGVTRQNKPLRAEMNKLWRHFELTKLPIRLAYRDVKQERCRNKRQFYFWLRNQREIKMIVEHEENNSYMRAA